MSEQNKWPKEEKEQFSPVSVLDIPFGDDDEEEEEEVSSPFQSRLTLVEGTKHKFMQKLHRFESLAKLEPVALENRFSLSDESPNQETFQGTIKHDQIEDKALDLLHELTSSIPSNSFKFLEDNLILDFFKEKVAEAGSSSNHSFEQCLLIEANDWITGNPHELFLEWEVHTNRHV